MENLKKTSLYKEYEKYGGKVVDFAGWALPIQFEGIIQEHEAVRNNAGLFDVSHMGEIVIKGSDSLAFVQNLITNDVLAIKDNEMLYALMCYENGTVVDDVIVYRYSINHFLIVVNASNIAKDYVWMVKCKNNLEIEIENISQAVCQIAIQGPKSEEIISKLTEFDLGSLKFFNFADDVDVAGCNCLISRSGYTGEDGFEIYSKNECGPVLYNKILEIGKDMGIKAAGLGCRDTLRFEATLPLYGNEISDSVTPLEAGLGMFVNFNKAEFVGKKALLEEKNKGSKRKLVGFEIKQKSVPRHGYEVKFEDANIGTVTTGYFSPTLKKYIGLALVDSKYSSIGTEIDISIRNKTVKAEVISKKFYEKKYKF